MQLEAGVGLGRLLRPPARRRSRESHLSLAEERSDCEACRARAGRLDGRAGRGLPGMGWLAACRDSDSRPLCRMAMASELPRASQAGLSDCRSRDGGMGTAAARWQTAGLNFAVSWRATIFPKRNGTPDELIR